MIFNRKTWIFPSGMFLSVFTILLILITHSESSPVNSAAIFSESKKFIASLSDEERKWLETHPVIRVVQDPGWPPVEFINKHGDASGMSADYLELIEQRLGIKFERIQNLNWGEAYSQLKDWKIDMTTSVAVTPERAQFWAFTKPYLKIPIVITTQLDVSYIASMRELAGKNVAIVKGYAVEDWISKDFPAIKLIPVKSTQEGLEMLQKGEVFAYLDNLLVIGDYQAKMKTTNLKIAGQTPYVNAQCMAVRKDWAPFAAILQKALDSISDEEQNKIYRKWLPVRYEHGFNYALFWKMLSVFGVILVSMLLWNRKLAHEIQSRKRAEVALRKSEAEHRRYLMGAPFGVFVADDRGRHIQVNPTACHITGYDEQELLTMSIHDFFFEESIDKGLVQFQTVIDKGEAQTELLIRPKSGEKRWWSITAVKISESRVLVFGYDITIRKQAENKILEANALLKSVLEGTSDAIFVKDLNGRYLLVNSGTCLAIGRDATEIIGKNDHDLFPSESADIINEVDNKVFVAGETVLAEERLKTISGITFWLTQKSPFLNENGEVIGIIGISRDITPIKNNEKERNKLQAQLQQAQKMEAVGNLAGGIAHDFNNMLGVILGRAEMAMEELVPTQSLFNDLNEIRIAAERSANITRQLLTFARKQVVVPKVVDMNKTMEGMLKMLRRLIGEDIEMTWLPGVDIWSVKVDPSQVDQFLANLLVNARDAIGGVGEIIVETGNRVFDDEYCLSHSGFFPGDYVKLAVSDTGHGIDKESIPHIFEPFFTTKDVGEGTGLGLATVYGVVKQNNGFINVYSEPGQGTTFTIYLPRHIGPSEVVPPDREEIAVGGDESILLVEDESTIQKMITTMLVRMGYTVLTAGTPAEAINLMKDYPKTIHLLLTDVIMPEMNGLKLAEQLLVVQPAMKCLFMSGYTANIITRQGILDEGVHFIQKPFSKNDLSAKVREVLGS